MGATFFALKTEEEINEAMASWREKISSGAKPIGKLGSPVMWVSSEKFWVSFVRYSAPRRRIDDSYWNPHGLSTEKFRQNMVVELNPPPKGTGGAQAVIATDQSNKRWILHSGFLRVPFRKGGAGAIKHHDFARLGRVTSVQVEMPNGKVRPYFRVANIDSSAAQLRRQIGEYVRLCSVVRSRWAAPKKQSETQKKVTNAEASGSPEKPSVYTIAAREEITVDKQHPKMWAALEASLKSLNIDCNNKRVDLYGPDMIADTQPKMLFEIKTSSDIASIQQAIGQLFLYENLLGSAYRKILVLPKAPRKELNDSLKELSIEVLLCVKASKSYKIKKGVLKLLCKK